MTRTVDGGVRRLAVWKKKKSVTDAMKSSVGYGAKDWHCEKKC